MHAVSGGVEEVQGAAVALRWGGTGGCGVGGAFVEGEMHPNGRALRQGVECCCWCMCACAGAEGAPSFPLNNHGCAALDSNSPPLDINHLPTLN